MASGQRSPTAETKAHIKIVSLSTCDSLRILHNFWFPLSCRWYILRISCPWMHVFFKCQEFCIFNLGRFQQNHIYDKFPNFFPNEEEALLIFRNAIWTALYFPLCLWMSFCFKKSGCQLSILKMGSGANSLISNCTFFFPFFCFSALGLIFIIPPNRTIVDAWVLCISLLLPAVLGTGVPLRALPISGPMH